MTQEELDALMDVDLDEMQDEAASAKEESTPTEEEHYEPSAEEYKVSATSNWPPPPPTDDNKMVHQLDDVTKESKKKEIYNFRKAREVLIGKKLAIYDNGITIYTGICINVYQSPLGQTKKVKVLFKDRHCFKISIDVITESECAGKTTKPVKSRKFVLVN